MVRWTICVSNYFLFLLHHQGFYCEKTLPALQLSEVLPHSLLKQPKQNLNSTHIVWIDLFYTSAIGHGKKMP